MFNTSKTILFVVILSMTISLAAADRGGFRKKKSKITFNIDLHNSLRSSVFYNLRTGSITYKGSTVTGEQRFGNTIYENSIVSYKKGNTIYVLPIKNKVIIPQYSPSSGAKIIIRP